MDLDYTDRDGMRLIRVGETRIDAAIAISFKDQMRPLTQNCPKQVILDMSDVAFIDSSGLGAVVAAMKQVENGVSLELACLSDTVEKVFRLTRMDTIFKIHNALPNTSESDIANAS